MSSRQREDIPAWVADYVGLPFAEHGRDRHGIDCWGLVRLVLAERFGIEVPSYAGDYPGICDKAEIGRLIEDGMGPWRAVPATRACAGDGVLFKTLDRETRTAWPGHVGIVVAPGWMLHCERGKETVMERYVAPKWGTRLIGVYRYAGERDVPQ